MLATVNIGGHPPTAGVLAQYGLTWETCQVCGGMQLQLEIDARLAIDLKDACYQELTLAKQELRRCPALVLGRLWHPRVQLSKLQPRRLLPSRPLTRLIVKRNTPCWIRRILSSAWGAAE